MRFEQGWLFSFGETFAGVSHPLNTLVGWTVLGQLTAAQKLSISFQEAHGKITVRGLWESSFFRERDGHGGELEVSPLDALQEFCSPSPGSSWFCINFPFTPLKCLLSDSKICMKLGEDVNRQQHPWRSGRTWTEGGSEPAGFAGRARFLPEGSGSRSCW